MAVTVQYPGTVPGEPATAPSMRGLRIALVRASSTISPPDASKRGWLAASSR